MVTGKWSPLKVAWRGGGNGIVVAYLVSMARVWRRLGGSHFVLQVATTLWSLLRRPFIHDKWRVNGVHFYFSDHQKGVRLSTRHQPIAWSTFGPFSYQW